jgi:hypothetical protein
MSPLWRVSSITLAVSLILVVLGDYLDSHWNPTGGANVGAAFLVVVGWGVGALGVLFLVSAIVGDLARAQQDHDHRRDTGV